MFGWLESTSLALWVGESLWGYPIMLGMHAIGLSIVVGIFIMLDIRLLGWIDGVSFGAFRTLFKLAWCGLLLNALSGFALFSSQATTFVESPPFLIKIASIFAGVCIAVLIQRRLKLSASAWDSEGMSIDAATSRLAIFSIFCWFGAIIAGRLIAYL